MPSGLLEFLSREPCQTTINEFGPKTHGSARFATFNEVINSGLSEKGEGRFLAPYVDTFQGDNNYQSCNVYGRRPSSIQGELLPINHGITVSKTQGGKSTGQLMMNLLDYSGPAMVNDPKTELFQTTAGYRSTTLGHKIYRIAPECEDSHAWNPLSSLRTVPNVPYNEWSLSQRADEEDDARYLVELLITPSGNPAHVFWENLTQEVFVGVLLYVATSEIFEQSDDVPVGCTEAEIEEFELFKQCQVRERSMYEVFRLLHIQPKAFKKLLKIMTKSDRFLIQKSASAFMRLDSGKGDLGPSVFAMLTANLGAWSSQRIRQVTYKEPSAADLSKSIVNDFEFTDLADGKTTIYINFEPELLGSQSVLRVLFGVAMRQLKHKNKPLMKNPAGHNNPPILFLMDEFATLGYMRPIEQALTYIAGYNIRFWFFVQDICQLKEHYPKTWTTFFSNTGTQCFFGINDNETAKLVSEMLGDTTVDSRAVSHGTSWNSNGGNVTHSSSSGISDIKRPVMTPDEVILESSQNVFLFIHGIRPILARLVKYYELPEYVARSRVSAITNEA
jgi:type IV secretion system protein VirD4